MVNVLCVSHEWNLGFEELRELSNAGYRVIPACCGVEAVKKFATHEIGAVIVNRRLHDIDVAELVSYFRNHDQDIPVVMISSVMPLPSAPKSVDAIVQKYSCASLLVPTLDVLQSTRLPRKTAEEGESWSQAA